MLIMADEKITGVEILELEKIKNETPDKCIMDFLKKNKTKAYLAKDLAEYFEKKFSKSTTRAAVSRLAKEGKVIKEKVAPAKNYIFLKTETKE